MARKPRKSDPTRRRWRRLYHRSRIYLPVLVLLFLAMLLYLPLSPGWLNGIVESKLREATGLDVTIETTRVRLITAEVRLIGLEIGGDPGKPSFKIGDIFLDGDFGELLAGGENWPAQVVVTNPSEIRLIRTDDGIAIRGDLATLIEEIEGKADGPKKSGRRTPSLDPLAPLRRPTPSIQIRNAIAVLDSQLGDLPPLKLAINRISVPRRVGSSEGYNVEVRGLAVANSAEPFRGNLSLLPVEEQGSLKLQLDGIEVPFNAPGFGRLRARARDIVVIVQTVRSDPFKFAVSTEVDAGRFELGEDRPPGAPFAGTESWIEKNIKLTARGAYDLHQERIEASEIRLAAEGVDVRASGIVKPEPPFKGKARVNVRRLPAPAIRLAQVKAREAGFEFDRQTSATLNVELAAEGEFAKTSELDLSGSVRLSGWVVSQPTWPHPMIIHQANGTVDRSQLNLPTIVVSMGDLTAQASAHLPILPSENNHEGHIEFQVRGEPEQALATAKRFGILPREINSLTMPLTLEVAAGLRVDDPLWTWDPKQVTNSLTDLDGSLTWGRGALSLRDLPDQIQVDSGAIRFGKTRANLSHLNASYGSIAANVDVTMEGDEPLWMGTPRYQVAMQTQGPIPEILALIRRQVALPPAVQDISGGVRARIDASGTTAELTRVDYRAVIDLEEVSGNIQFPLDLVPVTNLQAHIEATPDSVIIPTFSARVDGDATVEGNAEATTRALILRAQAEAPIAVAAKVTPKDFRDLYVDGRASATATVTLSARDPLPEAPDLTRQWIAALVGPEPRPVNILPDSPLRLQIDGRIRPGENATFFYRDFPHAVTNIRGDVTADETGFYLRNVLSKWGEAEDVRASGYVKLPHHSPLTIVADVSAPDVDINDWLEGWGDQPWAERPFIRPPRAHSGNSEPELEVLIECAIQLGRTQFLTVPAQDASANMRYEAWDGKENLLALSRVQGIIYGGRITGDATLSFPFGGRLPIMEATTEVAGAEVRGFLEDITGESERFHGKFTGGGNVRGEIGDYATWKGDGTFRVTESSFIGGQVFTRLSRSLKLGREDIAQDTSFSGSVIISDLQARFPDLRIESDAIRMIADGMVDFSGNLDFLITVDVISNRLQDTPILGSLSNFLSKITDFLISLRLQGTVQDPVVTTAPLQLDRAGFFQEEGSKAVRSAREAMEAGEGVLGRGLRFATKPSTAPAPTPTPAPDSSNSSGGSR
ncbi:AsmA-like C-terminal region-containing protein [bacterium]|nr:AsmA-like C-terminal region-containing protein [bacterium]